ncbi:TPA: ATP-binding protein [Enterobacter soli]|uniref:ATP-binding protein n=2 Tax=Enterobacteriaceae TaxID=543 RepID=A0AAW8H3V9_9ENTR|nr:ATP-binding protein [Enterobacter soli]MDQ2255640.1 ATP-binding protein [Enterobacter soli]MDQ2336036.1 ATP-binding protein [Enterobacter soli]HEE9787295.1 ATP-binding protein [Enterobacter soli]
MIRASILGEQTAENDSQLLLNNFIETPEYRSVIETKDSTVVVGRRGTGKSAMFAKLANEWGTQKATNIIAIAPEDYQTIGFRGLFKNFEVKYSYVRSVAKMLWKYGLLMEMLTHLSKNFKTKDKIRDYPIAQNHIKKWTISNKDFFTRLSTATSAYLKGSDDVEIKIGGLHNFLEIDDLEVALDNLLKNSPVRFCILIDRMDEGYENDEGGAAIVSGAISVSSEFNKRYDHIRAVMFQRDNILRSVQKFDPDYTRNIEGEVITIHWDTYQLQNLVTKRLNSAFNLNLENAQKIWDRCTADEGYGRELKGLDGFKKCLQFTLFRPRDLLSLLNQAFYNAAREERKTIILTDLEKTAKIISGTRLDDLKKEYSSIIPSLSVAVSLFENGNPELNYNEALEILDNMPNALITQNANPTAVQDYALLRSDGLIRSLYSVGFAGTHDEHSNTFTFCHDGRQPDREFKTNDRILIHPCYWIALNLSKNALAPDEAQQINDEYEIRVTSVSPQLRAQRIGTLISEVGNIEPGREHSSDFEEWVLTAVKTVFAGHLSNVEKKVNGDAIQRRDIVGTNTGKSDAWARIEKDYRVRQVVFEVKNYASVGRDEYRQMSSYLHNMYGRLGFIVTRDNEEALRAGPELDWVREIYSTDDKLIIRLSYKFFTRLLSKLRNPEKHDAVDNALNTILDMYERSYLSLQTTRTKRGRK